MVIIFYRIKQFLSALRAHLTEADKDFVTNNLNQQEKYFFYQMDIPTQKHAINVSRKCLKLAKGHKIDTELLAKAGLLHDIGKVKGDISIIDRSVIVLLDKLCPSLVRALAKKEKSPHKNFRHAIYIYYNHPAIAADLLKKISIDKKLIDVILGHHLPSKSDSALELIILKQADNLF